MPTCRIFVATAVLCCSPFAFAQHPSPAVVQQDPRNVQFDMTQVNRGKNAFRSNCGFCHGDDARGSRAPDLIRSPELSHDENGDHIGPIVRNGRPDKGMPGFSSLKDSDVADIVTFLHYEARQARASSHVSNDYPLAKLLTGNAQAGKSYFEGKGRCSTCHSPQGDLAGVASKYTPLELQQRMVYPGKSKVPIARVTQKDGRTFQGEVVHDDEFTLAIKDKDGYHSWARNQVTIDINDPLRTHRELMEQYTDSDIHNLFAYLQTLK